MKAPEPDQTDTSPIQNECGKQVSNWRQIRRHTDALLPNGCAAARDSAGLGQHAKAPEQAQKGASPINRVVTSRSLVGDISVVTLIRTGTLDHCQNAKQAR